MLKNLPRKYNPPGNGDRDMERPIYANKVEEMILAALGGSGKMTKHGIPSYSWRDDSSSSSNGTQDSRGGSSSSGGGSSGGGGGGLGITTGNITGNKAYGPAGGNAVGMGAPGYGTPQQTAQTLARLRPQPVPVKPMVAPAAIPVPRVKPAVPVSTALGPNAGMINTLPQIGGTSPAAIQQGINFTTQGPTSMPGSPVGPQIGGVSTIGGMGGQRGSWSNPGPQPGQTQAPSGGQVGGGTLGGGGGGWGADTSSPGGMDRYADMTTGGKFGAGSTQPRAPQAITDPYGGMGKMGMNSGQTSPYNQPAPNVTNIQKDQSRLAFKDQSRLPGMNGPTPAPSYNPMLQGEYTPQALNTIRRNNGHIPNPVDMARPENGVVAQQPVNYHTNWDWTGLGQMDKTGQTVTPRTRPNAVPAGFGLRNLPR